MNIYMYIYNFRQTEICILTEGGSIVKLKYIQHPLVSVGSACSFLIADRGVKASLMGILSTM